MKTITFKDLLEIINERNSHFTYLRKMRTVLIHRNGYNMKCKMSKGVLEHFIKLMGNSSSITNLYLDEAELKRLARQETIDEILETL